MPHIRKQVAIKCRIRRPLPVRNFLEPAITAKRIELLTIPNAQTVRNTINHIVSVLLEILAETELEFRHCKNGMERLVVQFFSKMYADWFN
jgi:hypothetical protein